MTAGTAMRSVTPTPTLQGFAFGRGISIESVYSGVGQFENLISANISPLRLPPIGPAHGDALHLCIGAEAKMGDRLVGRHHAATCSNLAKLTLLPDPNRDA